MIKNGVIMSKKGDIVWSKLGNMIIVLILLVILLLITFFLRDNIYDIWQKIADFMRFGG